MGPTTGVCPGVTVRPRPPCRPSCPSAGPTQGIVGRDSHSQWSYGRRCPDVSDFPHPAPLRIFTQHRGAVVRWSTCHLRPKASTVGAGEPAGRDLRRHPTACRCRSWTCVDELDSSASLDASGEGATLDKSAVPYLRLVDHRSRPLGVEPLVRRATEVEPRHFDQATCVVAHDMRNRVRFTTYRGGSHSSTVFTALSNPPRGEPHFEPTLVNRAPRHRLPSRASNRSWPATEVALRPSRSCVRFRSTSHVPIDCPKASHQLGRLHLASQAAHDASEEVSTSEEVSSVLSLCGCRIGPPNNVSPRLRSRCRLDHRWFKSTLCEHNLDLCRVLFVGSKLPSERAVAAVRDARRLPSQPPPVHLC